MTLTAESKIITLGTWVNSYTRNMRFVVQGVLLDDRDFQKYVDKEIIVIQNEIRRLSMELQEKSESQKKYVGGVMIWPLDTEYNRRSSPFGFRKSPITGQSEQHTGFDVPAPYDADIYAVNDGIVLIAEYSTVYGNYIVIDHGGGITTLYGQTSSLLKKVGDKVEKGDVIAKVGSTGWSTGNHLHFEYAENGIPKDAIMNNHIIVDGIASTDNITKIKVEDFPWFDVEITDPKDIQNILNYFKTITPVATQKNYMDYYGGNCKIEFLCGDTITNTIIISGNMFIVYPGKPAQELPYAEAVQFNAIIGEILLKQYRIENMGKENIISGEVISVTSKINEGNVSCSIKTDNDIIIEVDIQSSKTIDVTGNGRLVLFKGDMVEIGLHDKENFTADIVFIRTAMP
jgi:murein DD-endopeptidase MepM/ murein hydrolase activator NlpD